MSKIKFTISAVTVICSTLLFSCVTEQEIPPTEGAMRVDSAQKVRTVESPKVNLLTEPDTTKRKGLRRNG